MCFRFDAWCCFGAVHNHDDDDYGSPPPNHHPAAKTTPATAQRNGHHHYYSHAQHGRQGFVHNANGHRAAPHHQMPAVDEEDRKASNVPAASTATKGAQEKAYVYAGADGTLKRPAANTRVADGAGHGAHYYHHYQREPAQREQYYPYH